jgi:hypothetical protein
MKQAYYVTPDRKIESDENGNFKILDLNILLAGISGWKLREITPLNDAILERTVDGEEQSCFIPESSDMAVIGQHANTYGLMAIMPLGSLDFAQAMLQSFPCVITPIISQGGALRGVWVVESVTGWMAADVTRSGVRTGVEEYTVTESKNLPEAICLNVLQRIGMGKKAYMYYPEMTVDKGELMFLSDRTLNLVSQDKEFMARMVAVPELDAYAVIGVPDDILTEARGYADAQAVIQKEPLKQRQLEQEAAAAASENEKAPELVAGTETAETEEDFQG